MALARNFAILAAVLGFALASAARAQADPEDGAVYLYKTTTIQAAPGASIALAGEIMDLIEAGYYQAAGDGAPFLWRHSQGDHWDLILISPMGSYTEYFSADRVQAREQAGRRHARRLEDISDKVLFEEDLFAYGPPLDVVEEWAGENDLYHIEMFHALPGEKEALLAQRRMENAYLEATGREANMIFVGDMGSDVDVFTVGFYPGWQAYAQPPRADLGMRDIAARRAGFSGVEDIGLSLRRLITRHQDTFAVKVE